jgi:hypothetical protein
VVNPHTPAAPNRATSENRRRLRAPGPRAPRAGLNPAFGLPITRVMTRLDARTSPFAAGAVVTSDYLPWARATASSFAAHNRGIPFAVVFVDEPPRTQLRAGDPFAVLTAADIGVEAIELEWMRLIYNGLELCCALKPWLLRTLLADAPAALYLDSDLFVTDSLAPVAELARTAGVVLSPHALEPRMLARMPADDDLLTAGQFNAGFLAVGRGGIPFLDWWASRLARECTAWDPSKPRRYLDQRWLDLVVNYFPFAVERDPGVNVARWNLPQRRLELSDEPDARNPYRIDGQPLRLFHFSGFDPAKPAQLSPLQDPHPRADVRLQPPLQRLVADYVDALTVAGWQPRDPSVPKASRQVNGIALTTPVRAAVRQALIESERQGVAPGAPDPHSIAGWLKAPATAGGTSWYLWGLWASNAAVRAALPRVPGADEARLIAWSNGEGIALGLVPEQLAGPAAPLSIDGAKPVVVVIDAAELFADSTLIADLGDQFTAAGEVTFVLRAPGWSADALVRDAGALLAEHGLDGPASPDVLALLDAAAPAALAPHAHALLTRRDPDATPAAFAHLPRATSAAQLRRLITRAPAPAPAAAVRA